ncbi:MAG TPA: alpha/beta hydrolase [Bryobacteraceae bacterium]
MFLHGNAGNVTHRIDHAHAITTAGSSILVLDYRGYGKSKGHPTEQGLYLDADTAYDALAQLGFRPNQILLQGESLGTAVAVELASRRPCAGLILESPLTSLSNMAGAVLPVLGPILARGFDTRRKIGHIHVPLLVIHGDADEIVPFSQGQAVFKAANPPKELWRVPGAHHNDLLYIAGDDYVTRLRAFLQSLGHRG